MKFYYAEKYLTYAGYCHIMDDILDDSFTIVLSSDKELPKNLEEKDYVSHLKSNPDDYKRLISKLSFIQNMNKKKNKKDIVSKIKKIKDALHKEHQKDKPISEKAQIKLLDTIKNKSEKVKKYLLKDAAAIKKEFKAAAEDVEKEFGLGRKEIVEAFKTNDAHKLLKGVGYNIKALAKTYNAASSLVSKGIGGVAGKVADTIVGKQYSKGIKVASDFLEKHPTLKKVTGPAVAGIMAYAFVNGMFIGDVDTDLDMTSAVDALAGNYNLEEMFSGANGLKFIGLLSAGMMGGIGMGWLGDTDKNAMLSALIVSSKKMRDKIFSDENKNKVEMNKPENPGMFKKLVDGIKGIGGKKVEATAFSIIL